MVNTVVEVGKNGRCNFVLVEGVGSFHILEVEEGKRTKCNHRKVVVQVVGTHHMTVEVAEEEDSGRILVVVEGDSLGKHSYCTAVEVVGIAAVGHSCKHRMRQGKSLFNTKKIKTKFSIKTIVFKYSILEAKEKCLKSLIRQKGKDDRKIFMTKPWENLDLCKNKRRKKNA